MNYKTALLIGIVAACLTACEAAPYAFNALGFGVTQYLSSQRQTEIMEKMEGYDGKLDAIDSKLNLIALASGVDTMALNGASAGEKTETPLLPFAGLFGLLGLLAPIILKVGKGYAETKGISVDDKAIIDEITNKLKGLKK